MNSTRTARPFGGPGSSSRIQMLRFGAVFRSITAPRRSKTAAKRSKTTPKRSKTALRRSKTVPRRLKTAGRPKARFELSFWIFLIYWFTLVNSVLEDHHRYGQVWVCSNGQSGVVRGSCRVYSVLTTKSGSRWPRSAASIKC